MVCINSLGVVRLAVLLLDAEAAQFVLQGVAAAAAVCEGQGVAGVVVEPGQTASSSMAK
jgi:hypothetical protein